MPGLETKADLTSSILASVNGSLPALSPLEKQPAFLKMFCHLQMNTALAIFTKLRTKSMQLLRAYGRADGPTGSRRVAHEP
jgi:hypothetical protein